MIYFTAIHQSQSRFLSYNMPSEEGLNNLRVILNIPFGKFFCFSSQSPESISSEALYNACLLLLVDHPSSWTPHNQHYLLLDSWWRHFQFQNQESSQQKLHFLSRFVINQNQDPLSLNEHFCPGRYTYSSSSLVARVPLGIETTYLITSSVRCVCTYVSILTHLLCSIKATQEPELPLAPSVEMPLLFSQTNMRPLEAPVSPCSVICLDQEQWGLWGAHYIYTKSRPSLET